MNTNLSMFLLNKSEMNSISGGAIWRCSYNDHIENIASPISGEIDFLDSPSNWDEERMANYLYAQLGYPFEVQCRAITMEIHLSDPV